MEFPNRILRSTHSLAIRLLLAAALFTGLASNARAEERILWYSIGDGLTNTTNLQNAINFAVANNFNAICLLTRYRSNAYYIPNRDNATFANPEPNNSGAAGDTLQFAIDRGHQAGLRVYASFVAFMVTDGSASLPGHINSDWLQWIYRGNTTANSSIYSPDTGYPRPMTTADSSEGLWVDPAHPALRTYTLNVLKDLVTNYDLDGIIFDRIRYPGDESPKYAGSYGYNPTGLADMSQVNPAPGSTAFQTARRNAVSNFLTQAYSQVTAIKPWMIMGAAPVIYGSGLTDTYSFVYQHFPTWNSAANAGHVSGFGNLDIILPQYYRTTASTNASLMDLVNADIDETGRIYHGAVFPAYLAGYTGAIMAQNICDTRSRNMVGHSWFAYAGSNAAGYMTAVNGTNTTPCGTGVMSTASPKTQFTLKTGWDSVAPNGVTGFAGNPSAGNVNLTWNAPAAAGDGDTASRYLIYRGTAPGVNEYYANLVTKNTVSGTSLLDTAAGPTNYYKIVPVDDYNNHGPATEIGPIEIGSLTPTWKITPAAATDTIQYSWFANDSSTRGMGYNHVTNHLLVATSTGGNAVRILNANNGSDIGSMNLTGVTGGARAINKIVVGSDGVIWGCNLDTGTALKVYRWASEAAAPTVAYNENAAAGSAREGDDMDVIGTGVNTRIIIVGSGNASFTLLTTADGLTFTRTVNTASPALASTGQQVAFDPSGNGSFWWRSQSGANTIHYSFSGGNWTGVTYTGNTANSQIIDVVPVNGGPANQRHVLGSSLSQTAGTNVAGTVRLATVGSAGALGAPLYNLKDNAAGPLVSTAGDPCSANANSTSGAGDIIADMTNHAVYVLYVNNSIARYADPALVPVTVSGFSID